MLRSKVATTEPVTHCGCVMVNPYVFVAPLESISNPSGMRMVGNNVLTALAGRATVKCSWSGEDAVVAPPTAARIFTVTFDAVVPVLFRTEQEMAWMRSRLPV